MPINKDQFSGIDPNRDHCRSIPINKHQFDSIKINADQCKSAVIGIDRHWSLLIIIDQNWSTVIGKLVFIDRQWLALGIDLARPVLTGPYVVIGRECTSDLIKILKGFVSFKLIAHILVVPLLGKWKMCSCGTGPMERNINTWGPARRVAERPFLIVYGTYLYFYNDYVHVMSMHEVRETSLGTQKMNSHLQVVAFAISDFGSFRPHLCLSTVSSYASLSVCLSVCLSIRLWLEK